MLACPALALLPAVWATCVPISIMFPINQVTGHTLTFRASGGGLSWDKGVLLAQSALNTWKWYATAGDIQVKVLLDDTEWGNGANTYIPAAGGTVYPFLYSCEYCVSKSPMHKGVRVNQSFDFMFISFTVLLEASCSPQIRVYTGIWDRRFRVGRDPAAGAGWRALAAWRAHRQCLADNAAALPLLSSSDLLSYELYHAL